MVRIIQNPKIAIEARQPNMKNGWKHLVWNKSVEGGNMPEN